MKELWSFRRVSRVFCMTCVHVTRVCTDQLSEQDTRFFIPIEGNSKEIRVRVFILTFCSLLKDTKHRSITEMRNDTGKNTDVAGGKFKSSLWAQMLLLKHLWRLNTVVIKLLNYSTPRCKSGLLAKCTFSCLQ